MGEPPHTPGLRQDFGFRVLGYGFRVLGSHLQIEGCLYAGGLAWKLARTEPIRLPYNKASLLGVCWLELEFRVDREFRA